MKLRFIPDSELEKLPKIKTDTLIKRGKFHPEGLFSEQIFGPVHSYQCWCNVSSASIGQRCRKCGIELISSSTRRKRFAVIEVDRVINPVVVELLNQHRKLGQIISKILNMKMCVYMHNGVPHTIPLTSHNFEPNLEILKKELELQDHEIQEENFRYGLDAIFELACFICDSELAKRSENIKFLRDLIVHNHFFTKYVVVIPPDFRPVLLQKKQIHLDQLNKLYLTLLLMLNKEIVLTGVTKYVYECKIQQICNQINKFIFENIGKKSGILRNKMAGKRIDFSARAVATVNPEIPITHVKVSRLILLQLWKLEVAKELIKRGEFVTFKMAFDYIQRIYEEYNIPEDVKEIIDEVATDKFVILNRQPTLHRGGMFALKVIPQDANVVSANPLICAPLNMDFDGDTVALYRPLSHKAIKECEEMMWTPKNVYSAANATVQFEPKQGIVYGIYKLTQTDAGRVLFSQALGLDYIPENPIDSKKLSKIIEDELKKGNVSILDKVKVLGFSATLASPETISILDLEPTKVDLTGDKQTDYEKLEKVTKEIKETFPKGDIVDSGARASWDQIRQMIAARGYVSNFYGEIVPIPVKSSYAEGLTPKDYFISCYGTRKGILDVAENTAKSGYLTRKLIYSTITCELDLNKEDCGTDLCVVVEVTDLDLAKALLGRYYYLEDSEDLLYVESPEDILGKTIYLRTPMLCESKKICKTCYGKLADVHKSRYIGVIAAQSIGERSTQLVLRTFHTGGVAQGKSLDKQEDIVSTIKTIGSLDKDVPVKDIFEAFEYTVDMWKLFKEYGYLHLVHFEVVTAQRLWAELGDMYVRYRTNIQDLEKYETYDDFGRLIDAEYDLKLVSVKKIASLESWFLGMVFQNARMNFLKGLIHDVKDASMLEKIVLGQVI